MAITKEQFKNAMPGDWLVDIRCRFWTVKEKPGNSAWPTLIVQSPDNELIKLCHFGGKIVDADKDFGMIGELNGDKAMIKKPGT